MLKVATFTFLSYLVIAQDFFFKISAFLDFEKSKVSWTMSLLEFLMNIPVQCLPSMHAQNYNYFSSIAKGKSCLAVRLFSSFQRKWEQKFPSLACHDISWPFGVVCVICGTGYHWLTLRSESNIFHNKGIEGFPKSRKSIWLVLIYTLLQFVWNIPNSSTYYRWHLGSYILEFWILHLSKYSGF